MRRLISGETGFPIEGPIPLCSDNQAAIFLTINPAVEVNKVELMKDLG